MIMNTKFVFYVIFLLCLLCELKLADYLPPQYVAQVQDYPNIMQSSGQCLPLKGNYKFSQTLVCDPAGLLTVDQINTLNSKLYEIKDNVNRDSSSCDINSPQTVIGVALVKKIEVDNGDKDRLLSYAAIFSYYLFNEWSLPSNCHLESNKIVILYSKDDGVLYTFAGNLLKRKLPTKQIINTAMLARVQFSTSISDGLAYVIEKYREALQSGPTDLFEKS